MVTEVVQVCLHNSLIGCPENKSPSEFLVSDDEEVGGTFADIVAGHGLLLLELLYDEVAH